MTNFVGGAGADTFNGGVANDVAEGRGGADVLNGGNGDDILYSGTLSPAWSSGYYSIDPVPPLLDRGAEHDVLNGGKGNDTLYGGYGDTIDGGAEFNFLLISFMGASSGVNADFSVLTSGGSITVGGGTISNIDVVFWIEGSNFADTIRAGWESSDNAPIYGMGGNDHLIAGTYTGQMFGGAGNDTIDATWAQYGLPVFGDAGDDTIIGVNGTDEAYGGSGNDTITGSGWLYGGTGNDTINLLQDYYTTETYGEAGADRITGNIYADTLIGGAGADRLDGGEGDDLLYSAGAVANLTLAYASPFQNLEYSSELYTAYGAAFFDTGAEIDRLVGGTGDDQLSLGYGDHAEGGSGFNTLLLSLGGATAGVVLDTAAITRVQEFALGGGLIRNIQRVAAIVGSDFNDTLTLSNQPNGPAAVDAGEGNDVLVNASSSGADMRGGGGNDTITGGVGADTIEGGAGADTINGRAGDDTLVIRSPGDVAAGEVINGGGGTDTLLFGPYQEFDISGLTLLGVEALGQLDEGPARLSLTAGQLASVDAISAYQVTLTTRANISMAGVMADIHVVLLAATNGNVFDLTGVVASGYSGFQIFGNLRGDSITGSDRDDWIEGGAGNDVLSGGDGNDILTGGTHRDSLYGGAGEDQFRIGEGDPVAGEIYDGGAGFDTISAYSPQVADLSTSTLASIEYIQGYDVRVTVAQFLGLEMFNGWSAILADGGSLSLNGLQINGKLVLSESGNTVHMSGLLGWTWVEGGGAADVVHGTAFGDSVNGMGGNDRLNGLDGSDSLLGGDGNDVLNGGAGTDLMAGGLGNDIFYVDSAGDTVEEVSGQGNDEVRSAIGLILGPSIEVLRLLGSALEGVGNDLANTIYGNAEGNLLLGLDGNDTLRGGDGEDVIDGTFGNDQLYGDAGDDLMAGSGGRDNLTGGAGADLFVFADGDFSGTSAATADSILDFSKAQGDQIELSLVDANGAQAGNGTFVFRGAGAFTFVAGQLRYAQAGGDTIIYGDTNGDAVADFAIVLAGLVNLGASDFVL